ncbi:MAG: chromate transporter [Methylocystaceae bacterium]|nr:MAG: chromate transporter [Methylocystaceae bacterium]
MPDAMTGARAEQAHGISWREAFVTWLRVAALSFGGPAGQIAMMHRILVDEKHWVSETRFLHALNYCMLLPGPEAQQLATYIGWLTYGAPGGLMAGGLFVAPGALAIMALSVVYAVFGNVGVVAGLFFGLKAAVLAVVLQALARLASRALKSRVMFGVAASAFVAIFFFDIAFPLIVLTAGVLGYAGARSGRPAFVGAKTRDTETAAPASRLGEGVPDHAEISVGRSVRTASLWAAAWAAPVAFVFLTLGPDHVFTQIGVFFSKMAVVTFGGAYAALAYVAQQAVDGFHWLKPGEMLDGLGMAETTPGPLIMVLQFVGFMAAYRNPGELPPLLAGLLTTWVTFTPCFLWIFLGAPYIERLRGNEALNGALSTITAAVVGVILNLAIWFAIHSMFRQTYAVRGFGFDFEVPVVASVDGFALSLSIAAALALFRFRAGLLQTLAGCSAAGIALYMVGAIQSAGHA